jgi:putative oxidoreductase
VFGIVLITHELPKVLRTGHGEMAEPAAGAVRFIETRLHLPAPIHFGYFVTALETVGVLLRAFGLLTRVVALMVAIEMAATCFVMGPTWVWAM